MKIFGKGVAGVAAVLLVASSVNAAVLDMRVGAGISAADPKGFERRVNSLSGTDLSAKNFETFNADVIFHLPAVPFTLGARYEQAYQARSGSAADWKLNVNNLSVLTELRIIDSVFYAGPFVGVGFPWATLKYSDSASSVRHQLNCRQLSYFGGIGAGVYLGPFLVGGEAGYKSIRLKGGSSSGNSVNTNINLEGFYGKALAGVSF